MLIAFLTFSSPALYSQNDFLIFKKKYKTIATFSKNSYIAFKMKNRQWQAGYITKVQNDSFWIRPMVVFYTLMSIDTVGYNVQPFALHDVYEMPKRGVQIDYIRGRFQITKSGGHVHWYWIKSGWIFRVGAVGYATLNVANGAIKNHFSFSGGKLGIAAAVFLGGVILQRTYKPVVRLGKKYNLLSIKVSN